MSTAPLPDVLYHGSGVCVSVLEPINGFIHAAAERYVALAFALAFLPDERGRCEWHLRGSRLVLARGSLDVNGVGYLYSLAPAGFEQRRYEWLSRNPVTPLAVEIIHSRDYLSWIENGETG
jgi:hypothetical protein